MEIEDNVSLFSIKCGDHAQTVSSYAVIAKRCYTVNQLSSTIFKIKIWNQFRLTKICIVLQNHFKFY